MNAEVEVGLEGATPVPELQRVQLPLGAFSHGPRIRRGPEERVFKPHPIKKVVILGMGHSLFDWIHECYGEAPVWSEEGTEVWSLNYSGFAMHSHVCFNMHDIDADANPDHRRIFESYKLMPHLKVVSVKSYDWLPNSYEYPLQEVMEDPCSSVPYFTNSTSYLVALALACRATEIRIYGCDFDYDQRLMPSEKFERGRANMEFWLGRATAFGCSLSVAPHSTLLGMSDILHAGRLPFYGYGQGQPQFELQDTSISKLIGFDSPVPAVEKALETGTIEEVMAEVPPAEASPT